MFMKKKTDEISDKEGRTLSYEANISIRSAKPENIPQVAEFVDSLLFELNNKKVELDHDKMSRTCTELISSSSHKAFIAFYGEKEVGMAGLVQSVAIYTQGPFGVINELYVIPEYRSLGVGKLFIDAITAYGEEKGWSRIEVGALSRESWQRTIDFYLKEGFVEIGPRLRKYLPHK